MALEPTPEQLDAIASYLYGAGVGFSVADACRYAPRVFAIVRDMVLEAAVKASCRGLNLAAELAVADRIRAMKGSQ